MLAVPVTLSVAFWERLPGEAPEQAENGQKMDPAKLIRRAASPVAHEGYANPPRTMSLRNGRLHFVPSHAIMMVMPAVGLSAPVTRACRQKRTNGTRHGK